MWQQQQQAMWRRLCTPHTCAAALRAWHGVLLEKKVGTRRRRRCQARTPDPRTRTCAHAHSVFSTSCRWLLAGTSSRWVNMHSSVFALHCRAAPWPPPAARCGACSLSTIASATVRHQVVLALARLHRPLVRHDFAAGHRAPPYRGVPPCSRRVKRGVLQHSVRLQARLFEAWAADFVQVRELPRPAACFVQREPHGYARSCVASVPACSRPPSGSSSRTHSGAGWLPCS